MLGRPYHDDMSGRSGAGTDEPVWLTPCQLETWQALHMVMTGLPGALGGQLQCDSGLSFLEYYVLAGLSEQPDRTIRMSRLAALAGSELSRLSHLMRRLEKRGFVRREPDPTDGRYTNAILTPAGHDLVVAAAPAHVAQVRRLVFDALDGTEQEALCAALRKIADRLLPGCGDGSAS